MVQVQGKNGTTGNECDPTSEVEVADLITLSAAVPLWEGHAVTAIEQIFCIFSLDFLHDLLHLCRLRKKSWLALMLMVAT